MDEVSLVQCFNNFNQNNKTSSILLRFTTPEAHKMQGTCA